VDEQERLRLEYEQGSQLLRGLTETRFKLLGLVPTLSGAVVALVSRGRTGAELVAIGALGLAATSGVLVYELRNHEIARAVRTRVAAAEAALLPGGVLVPGPTGLTHGLGVALVYGAALGGWCYLVAWGLLHALGAGHAQQTGLVVGAAAGLFATAGIERLERGRREAATPSTQPV
jgi:hypothetical protein